MDITHLPSSLTIEPVGNLQLYDYRSSQNIVKTKIDLSKNTFSFLRSGTKEVIGDDKTVHIDNKHFLLLRSGKCLMTEKISSSHKFYKSILLFFSNQDIIDFLEKHNLYSSQKFEKKSFFIFDYDDFMIQFVKSLENIIALPIITQSKIIKIKFEELMIYLCYKNGEKFLNSIIQQTDEKTSRITHIVENNKYKKLSVEELAFLCNMSISTFKRDFFRVYQNTPMKWFSEQRLQHAALLLSTNSKRPIDIYEDAGYESFSNFVQAFKKKFGITPKQFQIEN